MQPQHNIEKIEEMFLFIDLTEKPPQFSVTAFYLPLSIYSKQNI